MDNKELFGDELPPLYKPNSDERTFAILAHALGVVTSFLGPLVIYYLKKDESKYVADHAKESLNFQITIFIGYVIAMFLKIVLIGFILPWLLSVINLVLIIVAAIKASENKLYRYPFNLRIVK
ncbi:MAG: DUF4870 domain-containing protein [Chitinophagaceae bacterium]|jgi:uncharacterized Tic20 family protein|nr:DUF4870 domain-containing protein [Chitinophagaceae bacterium]